MSVERGAHTFTEITSQPEIWSKAVDAFRRQAEALRALWAQGPFDRVLLTGCGSTHYTAQTGAALFQQMLGVTARAYPASEIALFPDMVFVPNTRPLLITVSRSGETTETIEAMRIFRERIGGPVISVTCQSDSTLGVQADLTIAIDEAQETSIAQTRSFASMLIVLEAMAAELSGKADLAALDLLPQAATRLLNTYHDLARQFGQDASIERFFFLGSGPLYGVATEGMLKMKEMSLSFSESYHVLEFRHGPMSMVNEHTLIISLLSDGAISQEAAVMRQMRQRGAQVLALSEKDDSLNLGDGTRRVILASNLPDWARPVAYLPVLQLMAYYRALARGHNPDLAGNLSFVISLDESMT